MSRTKTRAQHPDADLLAELNAILELELAGVVRYLHYSLMVFGHARIPIVGWMREQAQESMQHAMAAGEHITALGGHPSLRIGKLLETERHDIDQILHEAMEHEQVGVEHYRRLLERAEGRNLVMAEYARKMVCDEEMHLAEIGKMLRRPGELGVLR